MLVVLASCNNSPKTPEVIAKNPATLKVYSFQEYYPVGATVDKVSGTLLYTAEGSSSIQTIGIKDSGVTKTGFDTTTAGEGRALKLTYKGVDCVATYSVVAVKEYKISGCFIVDDNLAYNFRDDGKVEIERYNCWDSYLSYNPLDNPVPEGTYESYLSTSGTPRIRVTPPAGVDQIRTFVPDDAGGLRLIPADVDILEPETDVFYVSTEKGDSRSLAAVVGKYAQIKFTDGTMKVWFTDTTAAPVGDPAFTVAKNNISFGIDGVKIKSHNADASVAKNFRMYMKGEDRISIVSSTDDGYKGYSFVCIPTP